MVQKSCCVRALTVHSIRIPLDSDIDIAVVILLMIFYLMPHKQGLLGFKSQHNILYKQNEQLWY